MKTIKTAVRLKNNMVMVFDEKGDQIPEYQGQYDDVKHSILKDAPLNALFVHLSDYETELRKVPREKW